MVDPQRRDFRLSQLTEQSGAILQGLSAMGPYAGQTALPGWLKSVVTQTVVEIVELLPDAEYFSNFDAGGMNLRDPGQVAQQLQNALDAEMMLGLLVAPASRYTRSFVGFGPHGHSA